MSGNVIKDTQDKMNQATKAYSKNLATVRAGRANPSLLDGIQVEYYGALTPLNQLASISVPEARLLMITPFDKSSINNMEKAIQKADLGISPSNDGNVLRISIPQLTEDDLRNFQNDVQTATDEYITKIDEITKEKEKEIMEV